jgi:hypothetical protein
MKPMMRENDDGAMEDDGEELRAAAPKKSKRRAGVQSQSDSQGFSFI